MGMEEEEGICLAGGVGDTERRVRGKSRVAGSRKRELRGGVTRGGARHLAIIWGHLAEGAALGVPRAWGAPCQSQTPARPGWYGKGVSSCSPVLFSPLQPPTSRVLL